MTRISLLAMTLVLCSSSAFANLNPQEVAGFQRLTRGGTLVCRTSMKPGNAPTSKKVGNFNLSFKNGNFVIQGNAGDIEVEDIHVGADFMFIEIGGSTGSTQFGVVMRTLNLSGPVAGTLSEYDDDESTTTKQIFCEIQ